MEDDPPAEDDVLPRKKKMKKVRRIRMRRIRMRRIRMRRIRMRRGMWRRRRIGRGMWTRRMRKVIWRGRNSSSSSVQCAECKLSVSALSPSRPNNI